MPPVHLPLFANERGTTGKRLGVAAWPMQGHDMAEMIRPTPVATLAHHRVQAGGSERGKFLQCFVDKCEIRIDCRGALGSDGGSLSGLEKDTFDGAVVNLQLARDGANEPFFDMVITQNLRRELG